MIDLDEIREYANKELLGHQRYQILALVAIAERLEENPGVQTRRVGRPPKTA